jgi:hypothetical protein
MILIKDAIKEFLNYLIRLIPLLLYSRWRLLPIVLGLILKRGR